MANGIQPQLPSRRQRRPEKYWKDNYNTKLTPENERRYKTWLKEGKRRYRIDLSGDESAYDLRGYWINGGYKDELFRQRKGHAPDTYKKPNHPTFSNQSIYHGVKSPFGGVFIGGEWVDERTFRPSQYMLLNTHPPAWYRRHIEKFGEGVRLLLKTNKEKY